MAEKVDRRVEKTRDALMRGFSSLILEHRRYHQISIGTIAGRANIGRSTFYEHFRNKEEILAASLRAPFTLLAQCMTGEPARAGLRQVLNHFWSHRQQARMMFSGTTRRPVRRALAQMIFEHMISTGSGTTKAQLRLLSLTLAEAQVGAVHAWLSDEASCTVDELADVLIRISRACAQSFGTGAIASGRQRHTKI